MLRFDTALVSSLTDLAFRLGVTATNIQLGGSAESLTNLTPRFDVLQRGAVPHPELSQAVKCLNERSAISEDQVVEAVLRTEGRIWGALATHNSLPEEQRDRLSELVAGRGDISALEVLEAHRWIRRPFIEGLLSPGEQLRSDIKTTPLVPFPQLANDLQRPVYLKFEGRQRSGSLKVRGSTYVLVAARLLGRRPDRTRIVAASLGNHAAGLVTAARNLGFRNVEIVLPTTVSADKEARLRKLGASVRRAGGTLEQAEELTRFVVEDDPDVLYLSRLDHPMFSAGLGTIGVEIDAQMTRTQNFQQYAVIAPAGSGGLLAGLGTYLKTREVPVFGVQVEAFSNLCRSFHAKTLLAPPPVMNRETLADSLAIQAVGPQTFRAVQRVVEGMAAVSETAIAEAMTYMDDAGFVSEGAAALPAAALLSGAFADLLPHRMPVVIVHTGENVEMAVLEEIVRKRRESQQMPAVRPSDRPTPMAPRPDFDTQGNFVSPDLPKLKDPKDPKKTP